MGNRVKKEVLIGRDIFNRDVGINLEDDPIIILNHFNNPYKNKVIYSVIVQVEEITGLPITIIGDVEKTLGYYLSRFGNKIEIINNLNNIKEEGEPKIYYITGEDLEIPERNINTILNKNNIVILDVNEYKDNYFKESINNKQHTLIQMHTEETTMKDIVSGYKIPIPKLSVNTDAYIKRGGDLLPQRIHLYDISNRYGENERHQGGYILPLGAFIKLMVEIEDEGKVDNR